MLQRLVFISFVLASCCFTQQATAIEEASLLTERATRSYDDMLDARIIRALVVRNKTGYFLDGAVQRGATYDLLKAFEKLLESLTEINNHSLVNILL